MNHLWYDGVHTDNYVMHLYGVMYAIIQSLNEVVLLLVYTSPAALGRGVSLLPEVLPEQQL